MPNELPIPPRAARDERAIEIARIWVAGGAQHVTFAGELWDDPGAWGIMLVDLARHVANAYMDRTGAPPRKTLALIRSAFEAEWEHETDEPETKKLEFD
jgi:hypothetical protein